LANSAGLPQAALRLLRSSFDSLSAARIAPWLCTEVIPDLRQLTIQRDAEYVALKPNYHYLLETAPSLTTASISVDFLQPSRYIL